MSNPIDWGKAKRRQLARDVVDDTAAEMLDAYLETRNMRDVAILTWLLEQDLSEVHRQKAQASLRWLQGSSTRTLGRPGQFWRNYYGRIYRAIKGGHYAPSAERHEHSEVAKRAYKRNRLRQHRFAEHVASRPDWMADSNLLPKKPPGK